ncbi:response regulator [Halobacteriovorax sp. HLS]|uniref:response regulator n=1 Tax=Halobacteriovorax sp. HLS TaxID=2234000 RepID=UPI000FDB3FD2|nr:response regulator [Halobacteriovorax sp. HLS]
MIIFLDDDPDLANLLEKKFANFGEDIVVFSSIKKLMESELLEKASLLCFDINLDHENGIEFFKEIHPLYPSVSSLCFSNYSDLLEEQLQKVGVTNLVCKEDGIDLLMNEVGRILDERKLYSNVAS